MRLTTDALIIRENKTITETDRFVTALTAEEGLIRASAKGARSMKSRHAGATQLFCYSRLTLYKGRGGYIIDEATPLHLFYGLREDVQKLSLAGYFCELASVLAPTEEPAQDFLRLLLNAFQFLISARHDVRLLKAVTELRLLSLAGYMPDLQGDGEWFSAVRGTLGGEDSRSIALTPGVLAAMRYLLSAPLEKCFSFTLSTEGYPLLALASESFVLAQLGRSFHALDFYHTLS